MKIPFEKYNPEWSNQFLAIKNDLKETLKTLNPKIEHIGSTSVPNLSSKTNY